MMKKALMIFLAALLVVLTAACGSGNNTADAKQQKPRKVHDPNVFIYGDADGDGYLSILDVTRIQRHLAGLEPQITEANMKKAIVSGNAELSVIDATLIQQRLVNIIKIFPVEDPSFVPPTEASETPATELATQPPTEATEATEPATSAPVDNGDSGDGEDEYYGDDDEYYGDDEWNDNE